MLLLLPSHLLICAAFRTGFGADFANEIERKEWRAFFADVPMLCYFAENYPELLLLPWERLRAMGLLVYRHPAEVEYTFLSHQ